MNAVLYMYGCCADCYLAKTWLDECAQQNIDGDFTDEGNSQSAAFGQYANESKDEKGAYKGVYSEALKSVDALLNTFDESNGLSFESGCLSPLPMIRALVLSLLISPCSATLPFLFVRFCSPPCLFGGHVVYKYL